MDYNIRNNQYPRDMVDKEEGKEKKEEKEQDKEKNCYETSTFLVKIECSVWSCPTLGLNRVHHRVNVLKTHLSNDDVYYDVARRDTT